MDYSLNAKSFYLTGKDLGNTIHTLDVLQFKYPSTDAIKAELPYLLLIPTDGPFPFSLPLTRLPYVIMSVGIVFLLYVITKRLFNEKTGVVAGVIAAINPFLIVLGRTTYEVVPASFFFLLGFYVLLRAKGRWILFTFPIFVAAFYSYIGTKLVFLPFIVVVCSFVYLFIRKNKDAKYYLTVCAAAIVFIGLYLFFLHTNQSGARFNQLLTPSVPRVSQTVDSIRKSSLTSFLDKIVVNKPIIYLTFLTHNFFSPFSLDYLLSTGDGFFRVFSYGVLYYIDYIFLIAGFIVIFAHKKQTGIFLILLLLVATIPQVFFNAVGDSPNYAHSSLIFPILIIFIAAGITGVVDSISSDVLKKVIIVIFLGLYTFFFLLFFQTYFYQYPLHGQDDYATRLLSRYIAFAQLEKRPVIIMSPVSVEHFKKFLFYANALNENTVHSVKTAFISGKIQLGNIQFTSCSPKPIFPKGTIVIEDEICGNNDFSAHAIVPLILDGGVAYKIYQDSICSGYDLKRYPTDLTLSSLSVENLSQKDFCQDFITH